MSHQIPCYLMIHEGCGLVDRRRAVLLIPYAAVAATHYHHAL